MKTFIVFTILILIVIEIIFHCSQLYNAKNNPENLDEITGKVWLFFALNGCALGFALGVLFDMF